jgi:hypothetical protein
MASTILWAYGFDGTPSQVEAEVDAIGIAPGCNGTEEAARNFSPADMQAGLQAIRARHSSIGGGFVWNYQSLEWTLPEWAQAIVKGCA